MIKISRDVQKDLDSARNRDQSESAVEVIFRRVRSEAIRDAYVPRKLSTAYSIRKKPNEGKIIITKK